MLLSFLGLLSFPAGIVGCWLIYRGLRGSPVLCLPKCARCGYDVRGLDPATSPRCPECGSDLGAFGSVRFGQYKRHPRLIWIGGGVLCLGLLMFFGRQFARAYDFRPNRSVVAKLTQTADQPWDWQELERRYRAGKLSPNEVASAIDQLITHLNNRPAGRRGPLHWSDTFLTLVDQRGDIPDEQFERLLDAFHGPQPCVQMTKKAHPGTPLKFKVEYGTSWSLRRLRLVKALRRVTLDDRPCKLQDEWQHREYPPERFSQSGSSAISGSVVEDLPLGKHELKFEIDLGVVPESSPFKTPDGSPGQAKSWPKPRYQWSRTVTVPVEIVGDDQSLVSLMTDEKLNPAAGLQATAVAYSLSPDKLRVNVRIQHAQAPQSGAPGLPIVASVMMKAGGEEVFLTYTQLGPGMTTQTSAEVPMLDPTINAVTLTLDPAPDRAAHEGRHDQIWGKPVVLLIPLERQDLSDTQP